MLSCPSAYTRSSLRTGTLSYSSRVPHLLVRHLAHSRCSVNTCSDGTDAPCSDTCPSSTPSTESQVPDETRGEALGGVYGKEVRRHGLSGVLLSVGTHRIPFADGVTGLTFFVLRMRSFSLCFRVWPKDPNSLFHPGIQTVVCAAGVTCSVGTAHKV